MSAEKPLSESLEDYLETILGIVEEKQAAKAKDVSARLGVNASSVTGALHALRERGLINHAPYDIVTLTPKGRRMAEDITRRHETILNFLVKMLAVNPEIADEAACKMEHAMPPEVLDKLIQFVEFVETCPRGGSDWIERFEKYCKRRRSRAQCQQCITECLEQTRAAARQRNRGGS